MDHSRIPLPPTEDSTSNILTWYQGRKLSACDACHSRKIKCDREKICRSCADSRILCLRTRRRKRRTTPLTKKDDSTNPRTLSPNLRETTVPGDLGHISCLRPANTTDRELNGASSSVDERDEISENRANPQMTSSSRLNTSPVFIPDDPTSDPVETRDCTSNLIRQELASHSNLSPDQVHILESALSLVGKFASSSHSVEDTQDEHHADNNVPSTKLPLELFYMLLHEGPPGQESGWCANWPDHISSKILERICLAVSNLTEGSQLALQYTLCIFSKATIFVSRWLRFCTSEGLVDRLEQSRRSYIASGLRCLKEIDFTRTPSLPMLQALLSGASLVQLIGETSRSWILTALAARNIVALGYHHLSPNFLASNEGFEIRRTIYWCYYMDKTLSMLLVRPSSLPDLPFDPATLVHPDPSNPLTYKVKILVRLAQIQDSYLDALIRRQNNRPCPPGLAESLRVKLASVRQDILESRSRYIHLPALKAEWDAVDFTYFSIATTVLRLNSLSLHDQATREECVQYARKALCSMQECCALISSNSKFTTDYIFWTVLLYPLTPFFVIFCNFVATSNFHDLLLLKDATATISSIPEHFPFSKNLQRLLCQLIALCSHLETAWKHTQIDVREKDAGPSCKTPQLPLPSLAMTSNGVAFSELSHMRTSSDKYVTPGTNMSPQVALASFGQEGVHAEPKRNSIWDDERLWELFNVQPSVEWFDSDYFTNFISN